MQSEKVITLIFTAYTLHVRTLMQINNTSPYIFAFGPDGIIINKPHWSRKHLVCQAGSYSQYMNQWRPWSMTHMCFARIRWFNYTPRFNEVDRGVYWYHLVRLSVCPSVNRIVSALYLQEYSSDPFHICTSYQATSEGVSRVMPISKFKNLKFWRIV